MTIPIKHWQHFTLARGYLRYSLTSPLKHPWRHHYWSKRMHRSYGSCSTHGKGHAPLEYHSPYHWSQAPWGPRGRSRWQKKASRYSEDLVLCRLAEHPEEPILLQVCGRHVPAFLALVVGEVVGVPVAGACVLRAFSASFRPRSPSYQ